MNKYYIEYKKLTKDACKYLEEELNYSIKTIGNYNNIWKRIRIFMFSNGYNRYTEKIGEKFIFDKFNTNDRKKLPTKDHIFFNAVVILNQFYRTGAIKFPVLKSKYPLVFVGQIGTFISQYVEIKKTKRMSRTNIQEHQRILFDFLKYCNLSKTKTTKQIDLPIILKYIKQFKCENKTSMTVLLRCLRGFTKHLYNIGENKVDLSIVIPKEKKVHQPKIPSIYSKKEIKILLDSIDRSSGMGKRNYAIILIATRLGLRASDISNLTLENLNWHTNEIVIYQIKTGKNLVLPLFADIGNAIIDYLKYGRPKSNERNLFLKGRPPYDSFSSSNIVTHIVQRAMIKSGLRTKNRKFGSHSLRHSLAFRMLEESISLNVISEVLGHENSQSTSYYLRIDLKSMRKCTLQVPLISDNFYKQKGGIFYE